MTTYNGALNIVSLEVLALAHNMNFYLQMSSGINGAPGDISSIGGFVAATAGTSWRGHAPSVLSVTSTSTLFYPADRTHLGGRVGE